jgi:uncharacterized membrane protein
MLEFSPRPSSMQRSRRSSAADAVPSRSSGDVARVPKESQMPIGPVQLLVVSFAEPEFSGEVMEELRRLRDSDVIRLIDALAVQKDQDGNLAAVQWSDLSVGESEEFGAMVGALLGLGLAGEEGMEAGAIAGADAGADGHVIDQSEVWDVADTIEPGGAAAIALIEHVWAAPLRDAIARAGGVPVSDAWVHPSDLVEIGLLASAELGRV